MRRLLYDIALMVFALALFAAGKIQVDTMILCLFLSSLSRITNNRTTEGNES